MSATDEPFPDWETVLSAAARLQRILPDAVRSVAQRPRFMPNIDCRTMPITY